MKRIALYFGMAVVLVASCSTQEIDFQTSLQENVEYYASFEQPNEEGTRVYANEDLLLRWTADDRVSIFGKSTYNQQYKFLGETGDNAGGFNKVDGAEYVTGNPISHTVSVYPYQESTKITEDEVLTVTLPAEQKYAENTFGLGANTMVSVSQDNVLMYKNVGGYLMFKLYGEGISVSSITLKGNNGEKLAGKATVTMPLNGTPTAMMADDATMEITLTCETPVQLGASVEESTPFWFVVPAVAFSKGFTITVSGDGGVFEKSTEKAVTIERNCLSKMSPLRIDYGSSPVQVSFAMVFPALSPDSELTTLPESDSDYSYGIRVQQYNSETSSYEPYAVGVFNDLSKAEISLYPTRKYIVEAAAINHFYSNNNEFQGASGMLPYVTNSFIMNSGVSLKEWLYHNVWGDAYYGKIIDYSPLTSEQCNINLQNESAGIKIDVDGADRGSIKFSFNRGFTKPLTFSLSKQTCLSSYLAFDNWFGETQENYEIGCTIQYIDEDNAITTIIDDNFIFSKGRVTIIPVEVDSGASPSVPEAIDLGLPSGLKWASFNLGATKPEEYGDYFAWGETEPYYSSLDPLTWKAGKEDGYDWPSYKWCMGSNDTITKYCSNSSGGYNGFTDTKTVLDSEDDAAFMALGGNWRMPTDAEWTELRRNCTWTWTTQNGVKGWSVTALNGNSIFLPAAGRRDTIYLYDVDSIGRYWSSSLYTDTPGKAWGVYFNSSSAIRSSCFRASGISVRPVAE